MSKISKRNQKVRDFIITRIEAKGFTEDRYGNWKDATGSRRYKFQATSYRVELCINTQPKSWMKIAGNYYKNVKVE